MVISDQEACHEYERGGDQHEQHVEHVDVLLVFRGSSLPCSGWQRADPRHWHWHLLGTIYLDLDENHSKLWNGLLGCVVATSCKDVGMKALLTARSLCVCGEHCGLVGISGMAKFVVNDVTVLSCGDVTSLARAAWGWWGYRVQYRAPPTRRRASDAPGYWLHAASGGRAHPDCSWIITAH